MSDESTQGIRVSNNEHITNAWGNHSQEELAQIINAVYEEIVFWRINPFMLPSGAAGKNVIREMTRLIEAWVGEDNYLSESALKALMVMPALMMQKPTRKSNAKQHSQYLV